MKGDSPLLISVACICLLAACASQRDRPPERGGLLVVQAYHFCKKCKTLQGGVYEKGPFKQFPGENKKECIHEWQEVTEDRFIQLAEELYDVDWSKEPGHFWNRHAQ